MKLTTNVVKFLYIAGYAAGASACMHARRGNFLDEFVAMVTREGEQAIEALERETDKNIAELMRHEHK